MFIVYIMILRNKVMKSEILITTMKLASIKIMILIMIIIIMIRTIQRKQHCYDSIAITATTSAATK